MIRPALAGPTRSWAGRSPSTTSSATRPGRPTAVDVVYLVIGRGTAALAACRPGDRAVGLGAAGQRLRPASRRAGRLRRRRDRPDAVPGPGPLVARAGRLRRADGPTPAAAPSPRRPRLLYGVRTADLAAGVDDFRAAGIAVELATDDGSAGHHGFVTDLLARRLERGERPAKVVGCGPPADARRPGRLVARYAIPCDLSLENHMACGFGACFSCVAPIRQPDGSIDLRRVCVEGPIFPAGAVDWSTPGH